MHPSGRCRPMTPCVPTSVSMSLGVVGSAHRSNRVEHHQTSRADPERHTRVQNTRQNRAMKPAGVHHVAICVADVQKGLIFYRDVLGMTELPRPDLGPGYWLDAGGQQVHLLESDMQRLDTSAPKEELIINAHFAIRVDDVDAAVA